jgi:hypothetical protein
MHKINSSYYIIKDYFKKEGFFVALLHIINFLIFIIFKKRSFIKTPFHKTKIFLTKKICALSNYKIMYGPYRNVFFMRKIHKLNKKTHWISYNLASQLLGFYELEVQKKIIEIQKKKRLTKIINIGAGDGYHIVSLIKNKIFENGIAFEMNKEGQETIMLNAIDNKIEKKIKILGEFNSDSISSNLVQDKKTLFLIDIEGGEFSFFNKYNINFLNKFHFIIEDHSQFQNNSKIVNNFFKLIKKNFQLETIQNQGRNPSLIQSLDQFVDDEKWLIMSEDRPFNMRWLVLKPL